jgi:FtsZ-binding cell division protein ZapB
MRARSVKSETLLRGVPFSKFAFIILLCITHNAQNCSASSPTEKDPLLEEEEGRKYGSPPSILEEKGDDTSSYSSSDDTSSPSSSMSFQQIFVDPDLLVDVPVQKVQKDYDALMEMARFFGDPRYRYKKEKEAIRGNWDFELYQAALVTNGYNARPKVNTYLIGLYKKTKGLQQVIPQLQEQIRSQQIAIQIYNKEVEKLKESKKKLKKSYRELKENYRELKESNRPSGFWSWILGLFGKNNSK